MDIMSEQAAVIRRSDTVTFPYGEVDTVVELVPADSSESGVGELDVEEILRNITTVVTDIASQLDDILNMLALPTGTLVFPSRAGLQIGGNVLNIELTWKVNTSAPAALVVPFATTIFDAIHDGVVRALDAEGYDRARELLLTIAAANHRGGSYRVILYSFAL